jgi:hypothetical protein
LRAASAAKQSIMHPLPQEESDVAANFNKSFRPPLRG